MSDMSGSAPPADITHPRPSFSCLAYFLHHPSCSLGVFVYSAYDFSPNQNVSPGRPGSLSVLVTAAAPTGAAPGRWWVLSECCGLAERVPCSEGDPGWAQRHDVLGRSPVSPGTDEGLRLGQTKGHLYLERSGTGSPCIGFWRKSRSLPGRTEEKEEMKSPATAPKRGREGASRALQVPSRLLTRSCELPSPGDRVELVTQRSRWG